MSRIAAMKVAIITGAGSGIGLGTAHQLHSMGMAVVGVGRDPAKLANLEAAIGDPAKVATLAVDVTAKDAPQRIVALALERFGRIDFLINNAGAGSPKPLDETDDEMLDGFLDLMLKAPFRLAREVIPHLQPGSGVVNVTSTFAMIGGKRGGAYSAAKGGLKSLTEHMACEYGPRGIRSNCVNRPIDVPLVGDVRAVVPQLTRALGEGRAAGADLAKFMKDGQAELDELAAETLTKSDGTGNVGVHTSRFIVEATKAFPKDGIMIRDGGASVIFGWTYNQCKPNDVIWNQNYGHIGTGLPYATGAMLADIAETGVTRPGMLVTSDSSFLFHIAELEVAVRRNLPLVCVVAVDFQWGLEVGVYKRTFGQGTAETGTHWSDKVRFDKIAEGLGAHGEFVKTAEEIGPAIARAYARGGPSVIHVPIDPKANSEEMPKYDKFRTWYAEGTQ